MDGIGKTSLLTAACRAVETNRSEKEGRLFTDPYAELLAGEEGMALYRRATAEVGEQPAIAIRTAYIDERIRHAVSGGFRQIVMLAAGMDTRAFRFDLPPGTRIFEIDRPEVLAYKEKKLGTTQPRAERIAIGADLGLEWGEKLRTAGFREGAPTVWLVEGLLMYLEESQVRTLFDRVSALASPGDMLLLDILSRTLLEVPHMKKQLDFLASIGAPWRFGENDPIAYFKKFAWEARVTQAADVAPARWPFPSTPLHIPNVPRGFFLEARKA